MQTACFCRVASPLGELTMVSDGSQLTWLTLAGQRFQPELTKLEQRPDLSVFRQVGQWLADYFDGRRPAVDDLPLQPQGTPFRQVVWQRLLQIPYGATTTYGALARTVTPAGARPCAQAVGNAVGHNPIAIVIPCHRVIGADGSLVGYGGGLAAKRWLLAWESQQLQV